MTVESRDLIPGRGDCRLRRRSPPQGNERVSTRLRGRL